MRAHRANALRVAVGLLLLAALAFALAATIGASGRRGSSSPATAGIGAGASGFDGAALPAGVKGPGFSLSDESGVRVSLSELRGQVVVLAFLGTRCAPACVLAAQQIRGALDELRAPVQVLVVSVQPAADTPARVAAFLRSVSLSGRVRYLSAPPGALTAVWRAYRVTTPSAGRSAFERALPVLVIDRSGDERVIFEPEQLTPDSLAHDIGRLDGEAAHR